MGTKSKTDSFANFAALRVLESGTTTQTTVKFQFPFSIMDKMALVISRIDYWFKDNSVMNSTGDIVYTGLCVTAALTDVTNQADPAMIDCWAIQRYDIGTAASGTYNFRPFTKDFSTLPGGGLLVAPNPLYGFIQGVGTSAATDAWIKIYYTYMELAPDEYWQLVESRRIISS